MGRTLSDFARQTIENDLPGLLRKALAQGPASLEELAEAFHLDKTGRRIAQKALQAMIDGGATVELRPDGRYIIARDVVPGGQSAVRLTDRGDGWSVLGFTSDNHLGSKHERLDVL